MTLLTVNGQPTYLHGANMAWLSYGQDIGGPNGLDVKATDYWFAQMQSAGMNSCRWLIQLDLGPQILTKTGLPASLSPGVWRDLDTLLAIAWRRNLVLNLCIFDHPEMIPTLWRDDSGGRAALIDALGTMFTRYANHPNILAWELFNEADNRMYTDSTTVPKVNPQNMLALIGAFAARVHATTSTLATCSNGGANLLGMFAGCGLDFYQVHWYDATAPVRADDYNVGIHDTAYYARVYGLTKPILVGEFYADVLPGPTHQSAVEKYRWFANSGYAGAWGWSASPAAADNLRIDWAAARRFMPA